MWVYDKSQSISDNKTKRTSFKIALVSFLFESDKEKNLLSLVDAVKNAHNSGCRLICFPECALTGLPSEDYKTDIEMATEIPGGITDKVGHFSKADVLYIATGLLERRDGRLYDTGILFDDMGKIILKYRRINHQWHSQNVSKNLYVEGTEFNTCSTVFGKIAFAICGDVFDDKIVRIIKEAKCDYLIVPMSRSFGEDCHNKEQWKKEEKWVYARQVARIGVTTFLINAFEPEKNGSFGGSLIISQDGDIITETEIGQPSTLFYELPGLCPPY